MPEIKDRSFREVKTFILNSINRFVYNKKLIDLGVFEKAKSKIQKI